MRDAANGLQKLKMNSMRYTLHTLVFLTSIQCTLFAAVNGPLEIQVPPGWTLEYKGTQFKGHSEFTHLYDIQTRGNRLNFSSMSSPTPDTITITREVADAEMTATQKMNSAIKFNKKYKIETASGANCKGNCVISQGKSDSLKVVFAQIRVRIDGQLWGGSFIGTPKTWTRVVQMVQNIAKHPDKSQGGIAPLRRP